MYECFARDLIQVMCKDIEIRIPNFDDLDEKIKSEHAQATGRILSRHHHKRYSEFDYLDLSKKLGTCTPGSKGYSLNAGPLASHERNLSSEELAKLFGRLELGDLWGKIGSTSTIQNHFQLMDSAKAREDSRAKLDEFILLRNQVAHNGSGENSIGPEAIGQWMAFVLVLAESLSTVAEAHCGAMRPCPTPPVTAATPAVSPAPAAPSAPATPAPPASP